MRGPFVYLALELAHMTVQRWLELTYAAEHAPAPAETGRAARGAVTRGAAAHGPADARPTWRGLLLVEQTARGVAHLHSHAIAHADLKPSNVLLTEDGARASNCTYYDLCLASRGRCDSGTRVHPCVVRPRERGRTPPRSPHTKV